MHAFVNAAHVDHTHPDAVIALTSSPDGRSLADAAFGDEAIWLDYERPGFDMSKRIAELLDANPSARAVLLERHGLVTWGATAEEAYKSTIEFITRAAEMVGKAGAGRFGLGGRASAELGESECLALLAQTLPALRGSLLTDADGVVLEVDRSPAAVAFASSAHAPSVSQIGAPCPDHLINTKHKPLFVAFDPATRAPPSSSPPCDTASTSTPPGIAGTTRSISTTRRASSRWIQRGRGSPSSQVSAS